MNEPTHPDAAAEEPPHGPNKLIVIVDDDPGICSFVSETLRDAGYQTVCANDGGTALAIVQQHQPDLILLDVQMPGLDGWDVLAQLRSAAGPKQPIVIMTGQYAGQERALGSGAQGYLAKPFTLDDLLASVDLHAGIRMAENVNDELLTDSGHGNDRSGHDAMAQR